MKKIISMVAGLLLCAGTAFAQPFWTGSVFNDSVGGLVPGIQTFDWSSSGSGNASGIGPAGTPVVPGSTFNFRYQAFLDGVTGPTGQPVAFPGLATDFEYTVVAQFPEQVLTFIPVGSGGIALFTTLAGGTFSIFHDATANANVLAGTGFDDGDLVASGTINPGQLSSFTATSATSGIGSTTLEGLVNFANPLFLDPALDIIDFRFEGTLNVPALDSTTLAFFASVGGFPLYIVDPDGDIQFKVDGSTKFSVVPEPSTFLLLGAGLLGMAGFARRRVKS